MYVCTTPYYPSHKEVYSEYCMKYLPAACRKIKVRRYLLAASRNREAAREETYWKEKGERRGEKGREGKTFLFCILNFQFFYFHIFPVEL